MCSTCGFNFKNKSLIKKNGSNNLQPISILFPLENLGPIVKIYKL